MDVKMTVLCLETWPWPQQLNQQWLQDYVTLTQPLQRKYWMSVHLATRCRTPSSVTSEHQDMLTNSRWEQPRLNQQITHHTYNISKHLINQTIKYKPLREILKFCQNLYFMPFSETFTINARKVSHKAQYTPPMLTRWNCFVELVSAVWTQFATSSRRLPTDSVDNLDTVQTDSMY